MKTADKQLLLTEILLLIGAAVSSLMLASSLQLFTLYFFPYIIGALMAQKRPQGRVWWKQAGKILLYSSVILIIEMFGLVRVWHDPDEGAYLTDRELAGVILLLWAVHAPVLIGSVSYVVSRLISDKS